ncbi:MAG: secretion protein [Burkholderiaceae bacterium]|nr:secretion protein [Burkholderiaceae bacterium]
MNGLLLLRRLDGNHRRRGASLAAVALASGLALATAPALAPAGTTETPSLVSLNQILQTLRGRPAQAPDTEALSRATQALEQAAGLDLPRASRSINEALQLDPANANLHFFNAFIYHLQARQGSTDKADLAVEGYQQAVRFDPAHWIAHEFMGLVLLEQKQYRRAQAAFAEVLLQRPDDAVVLARMLAASYLAGDARTACSIASQLEATPEGRSVAFLRSAVSVYAACGDFERAEQQQRAYAATQPRSEDLSQTQRRLAQWRAFHRSRGDQAPAAGLAQKTQFSSGASGSNPFVSSGSVNAPRSNTVSGNSFTGTGDGGVASGGGSSAMGGFGSSGGFGSGGSSGSFGGSSSGSTVAATAPSSGNSRMVLVDVVMVRTEDSITTSKGINLLNALTLQFGSSGAPAFSKTYAGEAGSGGATTVTRAITVPALAYSLNLANANSSLNEVLARPTLAAVEGMRSEFFSGTSLNAAVVSNGSVSGGSAVALEKRYGVKLTVLPQIMPNGMIRLSIDASRTFLKPPSANIGFTYKLEISEILANANVVMRMGDTLVLGGLSEKESTTNRDGVPGLQDLPGVQYLFSQQGKTDYQRSVLMLITPRPATYTWLAEDGTPMPEGEGAARTEGGSNSATDVLRARYSDWFKPYPNLASVFHHLNQADLYREFRTGDVTLERWDRMDSTRERLKQALGFLYY